VQTTRVKKEVPDLWSAGFEFFHVYNADSTPETFSFPPGEPFQTLSIYGNRRGLNVYSGYLAGSFFSFDPNIRFHSQFALERNAVDRRVKAAAWYVEPGYKFSVLPWTPQLNLRYAHFSGDPNPNDRLKQSYDPLFTTGGDRGFGSWFLGEIFGQYISPNSNLDVAMSNSRCSTRSRRESFTMISTSTRLPNSITRASPQRVQRKRSIFIPSGQPQNG
jgi:hypothetical protein